MDDGCLHSEELEALSGPEEVHSCAITFREWDCNVRVREPGERSYLISDTTRCEISWPRRTCANKEYTYVVDGLCVGEFEACVCLVDLLEVGLEETAGDTAAKHDGDITDPREQA